MHLETKDYTREEICSKIINTDLSTDELLFCRVKTVLF